MIRLGSWILAQLRPSGDPDEERDDLSKVLRRQQLYTEVRRLQRILATDESMSATRQIANRLAYRQLLRELQNTPMFTRRCLITSLRPGGTRRPFRRGRIVTKLRRRSRSWEIGWRRHRTNRT